MAVQSDYQVMATQEALVDVAWISHILICNCLRHQYKLSILDAIFKQQFEVMLPSNPHNISIFYLNFISTSKTKIITLFEAVLSTKS